MILTLSSLDIWKEDHQTHVTVVGQIHPPKDRRTEATGEISLMIDDFGSNQICTESWLVVTSKFAKWYKLVFIDRICAWL